MITSKKVEWKGNWAKWKRERGKEGEEIITSAEKVTHNATTEVVQMIVCLVELCGVGSFERSGGSKEMSRSNRRKIEEIERPRG